YIPLYVLTLCFALLVHTLSGSKSACPTMDHKSKLAALCVLQCVCATVTALCSDRRRIGGLPRRNTNTFSATPFERALTCKNTKWFNVKMRCDKHTFLAAVPHIHHNVKFDITRRVAVTIIYLSFGGTIDSAATVMGMSKSSAVVYVNQVLTVLVRMAKDEIKMPTTQAGIEDIQYGFEMIAVFPDWTAPCCASPALPNMKDGTAGNIRAGSINDHALWNQSGLRNGAVVFSGMHLLGDAGYKIFRHILTPFDEEEAVQNPKKRRYNYKLSQTRITVERAFGILKNRYCILLRKIEQKSPTRVTKIIVGCLVLHNLMIEL
ncbi:DDE superfamily endonuclease, partial [Phytophthora infestans]